MTRARVAIEVLSELERGPMSVHSLATELGINRSVLREVLVSLMMVGFVKRKREYTTYKHTQHFIGHTRIRHYIYSIKTKGEK